MVNVLHVVELELCPVQPQQQLLLVNLVSVKHLVLEFLQLLVEHVVMHLQQHVMQLQLHILLV
jgi:hypothetical protein